MSEENKNETGSQLVAALVKAQAKMENAKKDTDNAFFKSKYADLASVVDAIKPVCKEFGLAYFQKFHDFEGGVAIETIILHESGEQLSNGILRVPATKQDAQGYGSAITYSRRYSLQAAFGVAPEEDDGNAAVEAKKKAAEKKALENVKSEVKTASLINQWCILMSESKSKSPELFKDWWSVNKPDVIKDLGESEAKKVHASFVAELSLLNKL